jgi:hypothetical protein
MTAKYQFLVVTVPENYDIPQYSTHHHNKTNLRENLWWCFILFGSNLSSCIPSHFNNSNMKHLIDWILSLWSSHCRCFYNSSHSLIFRFGRTNWSLIGRTSNKHLYSFRTFVLLYIHYCKCRLLNMLSNHKQDSL